MLTLLEKETLVKLYIQNGESVTVQLYDFIAIKGMKDFLRASLGENRALGRRFRHAWPSIFPDFNPCNYYFLGYLKGQIFRYYPSSLGLLKDNTRRQFLTIPSDMLHSAFLNAVPRL
ncbi:transposable element Tcb1 transposase [Trichonephila clavipes]|nr:transposable element Tcb1 transposase [Trichonephila clavipes]